MYTTINVLLVLCCCDVCSHFLLKITDMATTSTVNANPAALSEAFNLRRDESKAPNTNGFEKLVARSKARALLENLRVWGLGDLERAA